jgi:hypothetical protein
LYIFSFSASVRVVNSFKVSPPVQHRFLCIAHRGDLANFFGYWVSLAPDIEHIFTVDTIAMSSVPEYFTS